MRRCVEILQLVAPEASRDLNCNKVVKKDKINLQVDKADFEKQTVSLTPGYHLSAVTYLRLLTHVKVSARCLFKG